MTVRTAALEADLATVASIAGSVTVVALPPSSLDPVAHLIRVRSGGVEMARAYDPEMEQP